MTPTTVPALVLVFAQSKAPPANPLEFLFLPILLFVVMYFFLIRPQRREQAAKDEMLSHLKKNDRVITTTGMFGTVTNIKGEEVTLRVDDQAKVKIRFLKSAIGRVLTETAEETPASTDEAKKS